MYKRPYALTANEQSAISTRFGISCFYKLPTSSHNIPEGTGLASKFVIAFFPIFCLQFHITYRKGLHIMASDFTIFLHSYVLTCQRYLGHGTHQNQASFWKAQGPWPTSSQQQHSNIAAVSLELNFHCDEI